MKINSLIKFKELVIYIIGLMFKRMAEDFITLIIKGVCTCWKLNLMSDLLSMAPKQYTEPKQWDPESNLLILIKILTTTLSLIKQTKNGRFLKLKLENFSFLTMMKTSESHSFGDKDVSKMNKIDKDSLNKEKSKSKLMTSWTPFLINL